MSDDSYTGFAEVYDELMDNVPYEEWAAFLVSVLREYGVGKPPVLRGSGDACSEECENAERKSADFSAACPGQDGGKAVQEHSDGELAKNLAAERNTVLDLGCGTGTMTELLARAGFDMIGVDNSEEMLEIAVRKREKSGSDILYLLQDMREFELYGAVGAVCSVCDSLNYILEDDDMVKVFSLVNNYLYPGGIFVFDFNTVYKYEYVIGDATIAENREDCSFIWENFYDEESRVNEYDLTVFVRQAFKDRSEESGGSGRIKPHAAGEENGMELFRRFTETHYQRGYTLEQMKGFLEAAGLLFVKALDADTHGAVCAESERIYVIAKNKKPSIEPIN